jgi:hypothetical protein
MADEVDDPGLANHCLQRAEKDIESWLTLLGQGKLSDIAPFGQMFVYQLQRQGKLTDRTFAIRELGELYYRRAGGRGELKITNCGSTGKEDRADR